MGVEEIVGALHKEGGLRDEITAVGLFYPKVDETLSGGDLEITVVMTGGCGSQFPTSKTIPIRSGVLAGVFKQDFIRFHQISYELHRFE